jgi:predicted amidohydrolase YtcJ
VPAESVLIRQARVVALDPPQTVADLPATTGPQVSPRQPVDIRIRQGKIIQLGRDLIRSPGEEELDAGGRWAIPGLWDAHVHMQQWSMTVGRLDVSGATEPEHVTTAVTTYLQGLAGEDRSRPVVGFGYRSINWTRQPTVGELDAATGGLPVALVSGDLHSAWLNSAAQNLCGIGPVSGLVAEAEWFGIAAHIEAMEPAVASSLSKLRRVAADACTRGIVGITDLEFGAGPTAWAEYFSVGIDMLRIRAAVYPEGLEEVINAGLQAGQVVVGTGGLATMGPLKVIFDGSLNSATARCCDPYHPADASPGGRGILNNSSDELTELCTLANRNGLEVAVHAIGDAAVTSALDAIERSGARGSLEHVQLIMPADLARFARLGVRASVQPAHLLDDRDVIDTIWADRQKRSFAFRSLLDAGAALALGSDAPVALLDPWLAMAAAVHRSGDARPAWNPAQSLTPRQALAASVDGQRLQVGAPGDVVLLDVDPLAPQVDSAHAGHHLRSMQVSATIAAGRATHMTF